MVLASRLGDVFSSRIIRSEMRAAVFRETDMIKHVRARLREMFAWYDFLDFKRLTGDLIMRMMGHNLTALDFGTQLEATSCSLQTWSTGWASW